MPTNDLATLKTLSVDAKIKTFIQLKDKRAKVAKLKADLDAMYDQLRADLLSSMNENDVLTLKTKEYTISKTTRRVVSITNQTELLEYFHSRGLELPVKLDYWGALPQINAHLKENPVPGVEEKSAEYVAVKLNQPKAISSSDKTQD
jgi:hypothetical protein